jgi:hypothetical protein
MAQSKKQRLKGIHRSSARTGRVLTSTASRADDSTMLTLLDTYGDLRRDIQNTLHQLRRPPSADLREITSPVSFWQVDHLYTRLVTLQTRLISLQESQQ